MRLIFPPARILAGLIVFVVGAAPARTATLAQAIDGEEPVSVSAEYQTVTPTRAQAIYARYQSVPGGITLEGDSPDLAFVNSAVFVAKDNAIIINDDIVYKNPVSRDELSEIYSALAKDDKLGVTIGKDQHIVFGGLPRHGIVARHLKVADRFLGAIAMNNADAYLPGYTFAPGYQNKFGGYSRLMGYFNFHDYRFARSATGELKRSNLDVSMTFIPLSGEKNSVGGNRPDLERISHNDVPADYVASMKNLQGNFGYYARERILRTTIAYGEVAAFLRSMKNKGITLDLK